jgi:DDE domain
MPDGQATNLPGQRRRPTSGTPQAIDQYGQVIDVLVSEKRDLAATRRFFTRALDHGPRPTEVSTDRAPAYPRILDELLPPHAISPSSTPTTPSKPTTDD